MHLRTNRRRNSGRREPVDRTTENILPMDESHRRWCNGEVRAHRRCREASARQPPIGCKINLKAKGCPPTSEISLEIVSNHNTRQMIIYKQNTAYGLLYFFIGTFCSNTFCHLKLYMYIRYRYNRLMMFWSRSLGQDNQFLPFPSAKAYHPSSTGM